MGGFFFEFEAVRTESRPRCSAQAAEELPPLPDRGDGAKGVLPRVLKNIISKRREVKGLLKKEKNVKKRETYEIRQVADSVSLNLRRWRQRDARGRARVPRPCRDRFSHTDGSETDGKFDVRLPRIFSQ